MRTPPKQRKTHIVREAVHKAEIVFNLVNPVTTWGIKGVKYDILAISHSENMTILDLLEKLYHLKLAENHTQKKNDRKNLK